jgi:histone-lysine N-methyltransferase SETMAR
LRYADEGVDASIFKRIVTRNEYWMHHYKPDSKSASLKWKHPSSPSTTKYKGKLSSGMFMLTVFSDSQIVLLAYFQKRVEKINSSFYSEILLKYQDEIRRKLPGQLARGVLLYHNNAGPHTSQASQETIQELQWELLEHPPCSPDLASSELGPLNTTLVTNVLLISKRLKRR